MAQRLFIHSATTATRIISALIVHRKNLRCAITVHICHLQNTCSSEMKQQQMFSPPRSFTLRASVFLRDVSYVMAMEVGQVESSLNKSSNFCSGFFRTLFNCKDAHVMLLVFLLYIFVCLFLNHYSISTASFITSIILFFSA